LLPGEEVPQLQFSILEVLELCGMDDRFPTWMVVPPTLRFYVPNVYSNLPAVPELWILHLWTWETLSSRCPNLQVLRSTLKHSTAREHLFPLLEARKENVERGFEVENVKMEPLKKLDISFNKLSAEAIEQYRELVEEVVDWNFEPKTWEAVI